MTKVTVQLHCVYTTLLYMYIKSPTYLPQHTISTCIVTVKVTTCIHIQINFKEHKTKHMYTSQSG